MRPRVQNPGPFSLRKADRVRRWGGFFVAFWWSGGVVAGARLIDRPYERAGAVAEGHSRSARSRGDAPAIRAGARDVSGRDRVGGRRRGLRLEGPPQGRPRVRL